MQNQCYACDVVWLDPAAISISFVHNALIDNNTLRFNEKVDQQYIRGASSYAALMWTAERSGMLTYDAGRGKPWGGYFSMRFSVDSVN